MRTKHSLAIREYSLAQAEDIFGPFVNKTNIHTVAAELAQRFNREVAGLHTEVKDAILFPVCAGDDIIMPSEVLPTDSWKFGNFNATVEDINDVTGDLIVSDQDSDFFEVAATRILHTSLQ